MRYSYNKAIQYSYTYKPRLNVCLVGNRLTWMGVILSSYICFFFFFLAARYKGKSSKVTWSIAALFEIKQIYGPIVLTTSVFVISWMSFPVAWIAFWSLGGGGSSWVPSRKINTNSNLVKKKIHATVRRQYIRNKKRLFHGKTWRTPS